MKGRTKWYPRNIEPVRDGVYECIGYFAGTNWRMKLEFVCGKGFKVDFPCVIKRWRGMTKKSYQSTIKSQGHQSEVVRGDLTKENT